MNVEKLTTLQPKDFGDWIDPTRPILSTDYFAEGPHKIRGHQHPRAQILYPTRGVYRATTPLGNWILPAGQALWIPPHIYHEIYSNDSTDSILMFIDEAFTDGLPKECVVIHVSPLLHELFFKVVSMGNDYAGDCRQGHLVQVLLDEINDMQAAQLYLPLAHDKRVRNVMEWLITYPEDKRPLESFASHTGTSMRNLTRLFKKETGMNFNDWRKQLILVEAIERLGNGHSVKQVALDLGYSSTSAFIAMFRSTLGVSPGKYLKEPGK